MPKHKNKKDLFENSFIRYYYELFMYMGKIKAFREITKYIFKNLNLP